MTPRSPARHVLKPTGRTSLVIQLKTGHTMTLDIQDLALTRRLIGVCAEQRTFGVKTYTAPQARAARTLVRRSVGKRRAKASVRKVAKKVAKKGAKKGARKVAKKTATRGTK